MAALEITVPSPPTSITSRVSPETVQRAVAALLKWRLSKSKTQKPQLLDPADEDFVYLILTLKKIPTKPRTNAHRIPLPHPLFSPDASSSLCLIVDDRPNSKLTSEAAKKKITAEGIPVDKVIRLSKLKSDYKPYEAKRKLCNSYDLFFADKRVIPLLPRLLGKQFFKKKKIPLPVDLTQNNWKEQIERACSSGLFYLRTGSCCVVRVGKVSMGAGEIAENVVAAIEGVVEVVPKKWGGVRSFHLKLAESLALPVYQAIPDAKLKIEGVKGLVEEGKVEVVKGVEKLGREDGGAKKTVTKKKGRIHEVRYMDEELGVEDEFLDDVEGVEGETNEDDGAGGSDFGGKKRKKMEDLVIGEKRLKKSASKEKSEDDDVGGSDFWGVKRKKGDSVIGEKRLKKSASKADKGGESGEKEEKKGRVGKLKDGASKVENSFLMVFAAAFMALFCVIYKSIGDDIRFSPECFHEDMQLTDDTERGESGERVDALNVMVVSVQWLGNNPATKLMESHDQKIAGRCGVTECCVALFWFLLLLFFAHKPLLLLEQYPGDFGLVLGAAAVFYSVSSLALASVVTEPKAAATEEAKTDLFEDEEFEELESNDSKCWLGAWLEFGGGSFQKVAFGGSAVAVLVVFLPQTRLGPCSGFCRGIAPAYVMIPY
ncbi:hypothetical protein RHSIM_Rhsim01G0116600 [Rhododendron simsii]|uniref:Ribosomal protein L1 n=1 Tax=Rhododendron simsii TaxID=118357 RepID=A0A834LWJ4_RHOSS|nr:hypothetical protein RHSIM_Rhsim01G0116600 [Rhododendron simsii]